MLPRRLVDFRAGDNAAAERAGEARLRIPRHGGFDGFPILIEAVGVAVAGVAHERAATFVMGGTEEEDGVVGVFHTHAATDLVPLLKFGFCGPRRSGRIS